MTDARGVCAVRGMAGLSWRGWLTPSTLLLLLPLLLRPFDVTNCPPSRPMARRSQGRMFFIPWLCPSLERPTRVWGTLPLQSRRRGTAGSKPRGPRPGTVAQTGPEQKPCPPRSPCPPPPPQGCSPREEGRCWFKLRPHHHRLVSRAQMCDVCVSAAPGSPMQHGEHL